jgi:hypothetical protein
VEIEMVRRSRAREGEVIQDASRRENKTNVNRAKNHVG